MKTWIVIGAAALQLLVLAYMAGERELILHTGRTIYLRTAPIDPQDPFRGDFVRLNYEIGHAASNQVRDGLCSPQPPDAHHAKEPGVYAALKMHANLASLDYVSDRQPTDADIVLRGKIQHRTRSGLGILYGLETYFVEQGQGLDLERGRGTDGIQVSLEMEVAVAKNGKSVLKGHRWSQLGIGLALENETRTVMNNLGNRIVTNSVNAAVAATLTLMNSSSNDLAVVDLPQGQSLDLGPDTFREWVNNNWQWTGAGQARPAPTNADVHILKPGEKYSIRIDLRDPQWFIQRNQDPARAITGLDDGAAQFRLFYRPPAAAECRQLEHADLIWHGNLPSRAFTGGGRVD